MELSKLKVVVTDNDNIFLLACMALKSFVYGDNWQC